MAQIARRECESGIYHVVNRGVGHQIIFEDDRDREGFRNLLIKASRESNVDIYAWCLMDNHIHLLLHADINDISEVLRNMLSVYALGFNKRHERSGHLFQGRFKSEPIEVETHFLAAIRYIHQNPVKAGIAAVDAYRWSSYAEYASTRQKTPQIVDTSLALDMLGSIGSFVDFHKAEGPDCFLEYNDGRGEAAAKRALRIAAAELGEGGIHTAKSLPRAERDAAIARLLMRGLSIRQIERITGVSRGSIATIARFMTENLRG